jgi:hypothetical protein
MVGLELAWASVGLGFGNVETWKWKWKWGWKRRLWCCCGAGGDPLSSASQPAIQGPAGPTDPSDVESNASACVICYMLPCCDVANSHCRASLPSFLSTCTCERKVLPQLHLMCGTPWLAVRCNAMRWAFRMLHLLLATHARTHVPNYLHTIHPSIRTCVTQ